MTDKNLLVFGGDPTHVALVLGLQRHWQWFAVSGGSCFV